MNPPNWHVHPLTPGRWEDFAQLFGPRGACGGCWCMHWHQTTSEFERTKGEGNRGLMRGRVEAGKLPGLLGYRNGEPVGWCAVEPRERYPRLARSRVLKPVDDQPVWSVVCFFVSKDYRRRGLTVRLLEAAAEHVRRQGGTVLEGYPVEPRKTIPAPFAYTGLAAAFRAAGFVECARRSPTRPLMRLALV